MGRKNGQLRDTKCQRLQRQSRELRFERGCTKTVLFDADSNIPLLLTKPGYKNLSTYLMSQHLPANEAKMRPTALTIKDARLPRSRLSMAGREGQETLMLRWHYRLGHLPFKH